MDEYLPRVLGSSEKVCDENLPREPNTKPTITNAYLI